MLLNILVAIFVTPAIFVFFIHIHVFLVCVLGVVLHELHALFKELRAIANTLWTVLHDISSSGETSICEFIVDVNICVLLQLKHFLPQNWEHLRHKTRKPVLDRVYDVANCFDLHDLFLLLHASRKTFYKASRDSVKLLVRQHNSELTHAKGSARPDSHCFTNLEIAVNCVSQILLVYKLVTLAAGNFWSKSLHQVA